MARPGFVPLCVAVLLALVALLIFGRGFGNALVSDDWTFLGAVDSASSIAELFHVVTQTWGWWYLRPVEWLVTFLLYQVAGTTPSWYHGASFLLHLANGVLVGLLAYRVAGVIRVAKRLQTWAGVSVAALFAFNWRHHESVFWYSSINELLAAFFRLSAVLLMLRWSRNPKRRWSYGVAVLCFALALGSKESAVVSIVEVVAFPAFFTWVRGERQDWKTLLFSWLPFLALTVAWAIYYRATRPHLLSGVGQGFLSLPFWHWALRFVQHLNANLTAAAIVNHTLPFLFVEIVVLLACVVFSVLRRRRLWLFALCWTLLSVSPYVGLVPEVRFDVASRFLYFSTIPASLWAFCSAMWFVDGVKGILGARWARAAGVCVGLLCALYIGRGMLKLVVLESEWEVAGDLSMAIVQSIVTRYPDPEAGQVWCFESVPDNYRGKYVFRNGIEDALYLAYGRADFRIERLDQSRAPPRAACACVFVTNGYEIDSQCRD